MQETFSTNLLVCVNSFGELRGMNHKDTKDTKEERREKREYTKTFDNYYAQFSNIQLLIYKVSIENFLYVYSITELRRIDSD